MSCRSALRDSFWQGTSNATVLPTLLFFWGGRHSMTICGIVMLLAHKVRVHLPPITKMGHCIERWQIVGTTVPHRRIDDSRSCQQHRLQQCVCLLGSTLVLHLACHQSWVHAHERQVDSPQTSWHEGVCGSCGLRSRKRPAQASN